MNDRQEPSFKKKQKVRPPRAHEVIPELRLKAMDELRLMEAIDEERRDAHELGAIMGEQQLQRRAGLTRSRRIYLAAAAFFGGWGMFGWSTLLLLFWAPELQHSIALGLGVLAVGLAIGAWTCAVFLRHTLPLRPVNHLKEIRKHIRF